MTKGEIFPALLLFATAVLVGCNIAQPEEPCGFIQNRAGQRVTWLHIPVSVRIDPAMDTQRQVETRKAAEAWPGFFQFTDQPAQIEIVELSSWEAERPNEQARTTVSWVGDEIQSAVIRINMSWAGSVDLESLMIHEFGHSIGLVHHNDTVMDPTLGTGEIRTKLSQHEWDALQCGYGVSK